MNNLKNSNIPYTQISKEVWVSITRTLENEQIGELMTAFCEYVYNGVVPNFNTKVMRGQWDLLIENSERMAQTYFKKVDNARESAKKRIANKTADLTASNTSNDEIHQPVQDNGSESLKMANNDNREIPAEFAIEEPVIADARLDNILTIPVNKPSLFSDYLTKLVYLHKKDTIGSITAYEEIEKEEVLDGMRNILLSSGYAADSVDDTIEECVTSTIAA